MKTDLDFHPASEAFPLMPPDRFAELEADMEARGQLEPITLCDGLILDGRNRYLACVKLGKTPNIRHFEGNPWHYVWSLNGQRRDLSQDHRAQIWIFVHAQSAEWEETRQRIADEANRKRSEAAKAQPRTETGFAEKEKLWICFECGKAFWLKPEDGVCDHCCKKVKWITTTHVPGQVVQQSVGTPGEKNKAQNAKASASSVNAGAIARAESLEAARPDLAEKVRKGGIKPAEARRQAKRDAVSKKVSALPKGQFTVIYADPPWSYNDKRGEGVEHYGPAEKHYPSMPLSDLKAMSVPAAADSVLFLWATSPLLPDALELAAAWGFTYKASFVWDKIKHNMGHYNSVRHEFLLVCTKGSCLPQGKKLFSSVQNIERTKHSEKPEKFREIIEALYPCGEKLELFARKKAQGWTTWGNEV